MVDALARFFESTGGAAGRVDVPTSFGAYRSEATDGWRDARRWLRGEPCVDAWHGITCCDEDHPIYKPLNGGWACHRNDSFVSEGASQAGIRPSSGDACRPSVPAGRGAARCVVVGLALPENNLRGELPEALCELPRLTRLDVRGNELRGALPTCVTALAQLDLGENDFWYIEADSTLRALIAKCRADSSTYCAGVPPLSCDAFGSRFQVDSSDSTLCVGCPSLAHSLLLQLAVLFFFLLLLVAYVRAVGHFRRLGERLDLGVNTAAIFFCHLQTVSIIGTLKLAWPPSVEAITEIASVDFLSLGATRPECTLRLGENSFYIFTLFRIALLLVLVLGVSLVQAALKACAPAHALQRTVRRVDRLEMVETVLFTFGLTLSWRIIFDLWEQGQSTIGLAKTGVGLASLLFTMQLVMLAKYALNIRALTTGKSCGRFANLSQERLKVRLSFLTERFGGHAPYWQYIVWLRQFLLTLDVWVCQLVMGDRGYVVCERSPLAGADDANGTADATDGEESACLALEAGSLSAVYTHSALALLIFGVFWALQAVYKPYVHAFQNFIELWLFAANVALVGLGTIYTALTVNGEANAGVEGLCIALLVCSLLAAAGYMVRRSRQMHLARRQNLRKQADPSLRAALSDLNGPKGTEALSRGDGPNWHSSKGRAPMRGLSRNAPRSLHSSAKFEPSI